MRFLLLICINLWIGYGAVINREDNFLTIWANFTRDPQLSHATYSITILDSSSGNIQFSFNQDVGLAPASTLKTVTGSAAFHYLGVDYRYQTLLQYSGHLDEFGILNGYIYIAGSGDPTLGSSRWNDTKGDDIVRRWASLIAGKGIKHCRGIVADLSAWPGQTQTIPNGYPWGDIGNYYGTGSSALNWRENQFYLILSPGLVVGDPVTIVYLDHPPPLITIVNEVVTGSPGTGDRTSLFLAPDGTRGYLRGSLGVDSSKNFSIGGAVPNSAFFIADELRQGMGWTDSTPITIIYDKPANATNRTTLDIHRSPPMSEIVYWFEQVSINMYGEVLVKTIAHETDTYVNDVLPLYCEKEHGIEQTAVVVTDGSGLSPENRITTWAIARVLFGVQQQTAWFPAFERALPTINGIRMKGGYIMNALSYAGYVNKKVFSVITNNFNGQTSAMQQKLWQLLDALK